MRVSKLAVLAVSAVVLTACSPKRHAPPPMTAEQKAKAYDHFLTRWDRNRDGTATCEDIDFLRRPVFESADADASGELDEVEFRRTVFADKSYQLLILPDLDADSNGSLSYDEFNAHPHYQFHHNDKNGDCRVSEEEAAQAMREMFKKGKGKRKPKERIVREHPH